MNAFIIWTRPKKKWANLAFDKATNEQKDIKHELS